MILYLKYKAKSTALKWVSSLELEFPCWIHDEQQGLRTTVSYFKFLTSNPVNPYS